MRWSIAFLLFVSVASAADVLKPSTVTAPAAVPPVSTQTAAGAAVSTATVALTPQDKGLAAAYSVAAAYGVGKAHDIQAIAFNYNLQKGSAQ
ncbi:MAG: hypothetical protein JO102_07765, partial [Elusimicrobia bacterium]|nr:hypothetical protein [Elusimicrobiota bacterium]